MNAQNVLQTGTQRYGSIVNPLRGDLDLSNPLLPFLSLPVPEMTSVVSVEGSSAHLPCDISPPDARERLALVLWYRRDEGEPIYR